MQMIPGVTAGAILRTGAAYTVKRDGGWALHALVDAGVATGGAVTLGSFSGGGVISRCISQQHKLYLTGGLSIVAVNSSYVQPSFGIGLARGF